MKVKEEGAANKSPTEMDKIKAKFRRERQWFISMCVHESSTRWRADEFRGVSERLLGKYLLSESVGNVDVRLPLPV